MGSVLSRVKFSFLNYTSSRIVYRAKQIAESERSEAKQGEARYTILERVEVKKLNFSPRKTDPIVNCTYLLKIVLCLIVSTF